MMRLQHLFAGAVMWAACGAGTGQAEPDIDAVPLKDWAVGILAADWRDSEGAPIDAFENARRDLARAFASVGFDPENITHLSLRPETPGGASLRSEEVFTAFEAQARAAPAGCLYYFTSHGLPEGMVLGAEGLLSPDQLDGLISAWCGERPTVVVVSACYSGAFVPALAAPNRLVMTAARPDRSSFGCGAGMLYPVFDNCVLDSLTHADDFVHLANLTRQCVSLRERQERLWPPSEPQAQIGEDVDDLFVFLNFERQQ